MMSLIKSELRCLTVAQRQAHVTEIGLLKDLIERYLAYHKGAAICREEPECLCEICEDAHEILSGIFGERRG